MFKNTFGITDLLLKEFREKDLVAVDCTLGNGNDLLKLKSILGSNSILYGLDIQIKSIENTQKKLMDKEDKNVVLICDSHEFLDKYIKENVDLAFYNLGYLPGGDKKIVTDYHTVIKSLKKLLPKLNIGAKVFLTFYPGHISGKEEATYVSNYLSKLNQKEYEIIQFTFINQVNNPPFLIILEKLK